MYLVFGLIVLALIAWSAFSYVFERSVKTPEYSIVEKRDGYEIRSYEPYITAQVAVAGTREEALNEGFRILAAYIFGGNTSQASIEMTAPVTEGTPEKIAMTAPVSVQEGTKLSMTAPVIESAHDAGRVVSFVMPAEYTLATLPKPNDSRVMIVPQEARKVAALRFSWFRNDARVEKKQQELLSLLERDGIKPADSPEYAGYNAPLTAPWMNRNEILVEID